YAARTTTGSFGRAERLSLLWCMTSSAAELRLDCLCVLPWRSSLFRILRVTDAMPKELAVLVQIQAPDGKWVDVGYLRNHQERNWFQIEDSYWSLPRRPVLGQTFEEHGKGWRPSAHVALPNWFSHLLPEGYLRSMVARAAQSNTRKEFSLLARIGRDDLPGATRIAPALALGDSVAIPPELEAEDDAPEGDPLLKFSLAGVQLKFSVYESGRGLTVPAKGQAGNVILKLPDERPGYDGVPEAELGC